MHSVNAFALRVQLMTHLIGRFCNSANCELISALCTAPLALLRELLSQLPSLHIKPHLCSKSAFDVCKRACSARASSSLTSKESALLRQDRLSSHSSRRRSCALRRSMATCSYSPVRVPSFSLQKTSEFIECFVEVADPRLHPVPQTSPV